MPIKVISVEKGKKNQTLLKPGIGSRTQRLAPGNVRTTPTVSKQGGYADVDFAAYKSARQVYTSAEIDVRLKEIDEEIEALKTHCNAEITNSLGAIQKGLTILKEEILGSPTFREELKQEIMRELRQEMAGVS